MASLPSRPRCFRIFLGYIISLLFLHHSVEATHVETFSDAGCSTKLNNWNGPNGYPEGRCTSLKQEGNFTSFRIVDPDPGCAITIYEKDKTQDPCSGNAKIGTPSKCYDTSYYYYSIDNCFKPGASSSVPSFASSSIFTEPSSTQATVPAPPTSVPRDSGANIGAIVGGTIGGVAFGVILAAIAIISFIRYRRAKRARTEQRNRSASGPPPYGSEGAVEIAAKEASTQNAPISSHPGSPVHELGHEQVIELQTNALHEMPDTGRGELEDAKSRTETEGSGGLTLPQERKDYSGGTAS